MNSKLCVLVAVILSAFLFSAVIAGDYLYSDVCDMSNQCDRVEIL